MARRATYIDSVWEENVTVLALDAGDMFGNRNKNDKFQSEFLCEITSEFGYDAIGLGEKDLNYGLPFLQRMIETHSLPFTNANVRSATTGELILPEYLIVEKNNVKFGICSILDPQQKIVTMSAREEEYEILDPVSTLLELIPRMREEVETIILLSHAGDATSEILVKEVTGIDFVLIGHTYKALKSEKIVNRVPMLAAGYEGRYIGRSDMMVDDVTGRLKAFDVEVTSLHETIDGNPEILQKVEQFKQDLKEFKLSARASFPQDKGSEKENYLGSRACKSCHAEQYQVYAKTSHKHAYASIRTKGRNFDPECLVCHTTGYQYKNGYSDERPFNKLVDVQCEACHGYGTEHSRDGKWVAQAKNSCVVCHDKENSPEFAYEAYWEKIKH